APLKADLVESGQVQLVYYDFPLSGHPHSCTVSRAARCATDQGKSWEYHDLALAQQEQGPYSTTTPTDLLIECARSVWLASAQFPSCLESDAHAETVTANQMLGAQLGVRGTPTVFVNGRQLQNWNDFQAAKAEIQAMTGASAGATT